MYLDQAGDTCERTRCRSFCEILQDPTVLVPEANAWQEDHGYAWESRNRFRAMLEGMDDTKIMSTFSPLSARRYKAALAFVAEGDEVKGLISELCITTSNTPTGPEMLKLRTTLVDSMIYLPEA
ncbi:hypothetical protein LTR78_005502 [Recurvomyces mirabilis]|uniref:Uncharacterized protein n=1 Tax=Recurvomyces mirabilis TaxID=574656 RepID=A0AAE0WN59_9PEZI|nr:hypothetical protein LTR78_005502 [Recurvomyces mirabilis]KAK5152589.1 hypothetical protein LTS14_008123 [Recurvomyces mirabilis]